MVQWFSGSVVFQECSFAVRGLRSSFSNSLVFRINRRRFKEGEGKWDRNRLGLEIGNKRREGVTRLIKLFYQSKLQNLQVQNFI